MAMIPIRLLVGWLPPILLAIVTLPALAPFTLTTCY
jgi:hypothetical protein